MTTITKAELLTMAKSSSHEERRRGFAMFKLWLQHNPKLPYQDQINATERHVLTQTFADKGMKLESSGPRPPARPPLRRPRI